MPHGISRIRIKTDKLKRLDPRTGKPEETVLLDFEFRGLRFRPRVGPNNAAIRGLAERAVVKIQGLMAEGKFDFAPETLDLRSLLAGKPPETEAKLEPSPKVDPEPKAPEMPTIKEFIRKWYVPLHVKHLKSARRVMTILGHLEAKVGDIGIDKATQVDFLNYKESRLASGVCLATAQRELAVGKNVFNKAIAWLLDDERHPLLSYNPVRGITFVKEPERTRFLTDSEGDRLEAACEPWLRPLVVFLRGTGMRINEALSLAWSDIRGDFAYLEAGDTKTSEARPVAISRRALEALATLPRALRTDSVFLDPEGRPLRYDRAYRAFVRARVKAGINDIRQHDMRHDFGSRLAMGGKNEATIMQALGHASPITTKRYTKIAKQYLKKAVDVLDEVRVEDGPFDNRSVTQADSEGSKATGG